MPKNHNHHRSGCSYGAGRSQPPKTNRGRYASEPPLSVSQNFLTSGTVIRRLLAQTDIGPQDLVVEIGPGKGHITRELLPRCRQVLAAELDPALCARLRERFAGEPRLRLAEGDFLAMPLPRGPDKVFANIPFSRTTDILRRLTGAAPPPLAAWLVVERGAALRFQGRAGLAAMSLAPFFQLRVAAAIPRAQFHPSPRVDAALLELRLRPRPDLPLAQREAFRRFLHQGLERGPCSLLTKRQIAAALRREGLPPPGEDANLKYVQWLCLFRYGRELGLFSKKGR